jgi:hypothetical protein
VTPKIIRIFKQRRRDNYLLRFIPPYLKFGLL